MHKFNFDEWASLYESDPLAFELKRKQVIENMICECPVEHRAKLRLLQMHCDAIRQSSDPLAAAEEFTKMSANKLNELKAPLTELREILEDIVEDSKK